MGGLKPCLKPSKFPKSGGAGIGILPPNSLGLAVTVPKITNLGSGFPEFCKSSNIKLHRRKCPK